METMTELEMWTIYDHPRDCPDYFLARKFMVSDEVKPTGHVLAHADIEPLRNAFRYKGLVRIARNDADDPVIVETWL